jgi:beta-phosphoglucomutase-like phosphatase (HAD superfamily)
LPDRTPRGVASNSPRALVEAALETAGLGGVFDSVIGADDVREPKPAPDAYLLSCGVLGARPGRGAALEGSPTGAAAARGARGLYVIEVPSTPGLTPDAHGVVGSLTEAAVRRAVSLATTWGR